MYKEKRRGYDIEIMDRESFKIRFEELGREIDPEKIMNSTDSQTSNDEEVLLIDGEVVPYIKTTEGYRIYYQDPAPDLPSAAQGYIDTQREK